MADWKRETLELTSPETGWVLVPAAHRWGYAREGMQLMLDLVDGAGIASTCCIIQPDNLASIRLAEKFGFQLTKTAHKID